MVSYTITYMYMYTEDTHLGIDVGIFDALP